MMQAVIWQQASCRHLLSFLLIEYNSGVPKKLSRVLALIFVFSLIFAGPALAQIKVTGKQARTVQEVENQIRIPQVKTLFQAEVALIEDNQISKPPFDAGTVENIGAKILSMITIGSVSRGTDGVPKLNSGLIEQTSGLIADLYANPPADTQTFVAYTLNNTNLVQPAYAQSATTPGGGLGFNALTPVLSTWAIFRNVAYFFLIAIVVIIGFMIMFRQRISAQAVITAQQAIPSVIIALIVITFSYAIAGLIIDLMYIFMYLIAGLFKQDGSLVSGNIFQLSQTIIFRGSEDVFTGVSEFVSGGLGDQILAQLAGVMSGLVVALVFAVAIAIAMFRVFFNLLKRYIAVVISVALAPIILMMGAIPGRSSFGPWVKSLIGNLSAFPVLLLVLAISDSMTQSISTTSGGFLPPYLLGEGTSNAISFLIGVGILLVLPDLIDKVAEATGAGKGPFDDLVSALGKNMKAGLPLGGRVAGIAGLAVPDAALQFGKRFTQSQGGIGQRFAQGFEGAGVGFNRGASRGIRLTAAASRSMGANQPDYLNPITRTLDKRYAPEVAKREEQFQTFEDQFQRVAGGGLPLGRGNQSGRK